MYNNTRNNSFSELYEKPREKITRQGPGALKDWELTALLLGSGGKDRDVKTLSFELVSLMDSKNNCLQMADLLNIKGIGQARASLFLAAMELARRKLYPNRKKINHPKDLMMHLDQYADRKQECFFTLSLSGANEIQRIRLVSQGIVNRTLVHPREVFADLVSDRASSVILAHNHPSGNLIPSPEDREVTTRLKQSGELLGIEVLDHIIFSDRGYYSFLEGGEMG
ncbi:MAG: DNA repair protein RadC [Spirochaetaceae bacterium]|jgi:DNA repair protein RadC|nr:DNA repair protein RadC [Spirochaetaceae bacterium]